MYKTCFECRYIKIKNQRGKTTFYCPLLSIITGKYYIIDKMGHRPRICPLLKKRKGKG